jgi:hypothetical protein
MAENLYGKAAIYTDGDGNEWPATIIGPLKTEGDPPRVIGRKNLGGKVTPAPSPVVEEEAREIQTDNPRNPKQIIRTLNLRVNWGHQETDVTGVRRASSLDGNRKSWRFAPEAPKAAPEESKKEGKK